VAGVSTASSAWSRQIGRKDVQFISGEQDELFNLDRNVKKLVDAYQNSGSDVRLTLHPGPHIPSPESLGWKVALKTYWNFASQIMAFLGESRAGEHENCSSQYR
jgi:hypothetical protein